MKHTVNHYGYHKIYTNVGEIVYTIEDDEYISVIRIYVCRDSRRKGIGRRLVEELEKVAKDKGVSRIVVPATSSKLALSFWLSMGYNYMFKRDIKAAEKILQNDDIDIEMIQETSAGVIMMQKKF